MSTELRFNNESGALVTSGTDVTNSTTASVIHFAVAPDFSTLTAGQYVTLVLDAGLSTYEIVHLTGYTNGQTVGSVTRAAEDSTNWPAVAHPVSAGPPQTGTWACAPTVADFTAGSGTVASVYSGTLNVTNATGPTVDIELATSGVSAGHYGAAASIPVFNVNADGIITAASVVAATGGGSGTVASVYSTSLTVTGPTGPTTEVEIPNSGVTAGNYGAAASIPVIHVNAQGIITSASVVAAASGSGTVASVYSKTSTVTNPTGPTVEIENYGTIPAVVKSGTYAILATDCVVFASASVGFTVTLPTASGVLGKSYTVKKTDTSQNIVTIATTSSQTIDGYTTNLIATPYESVTVVSDGTNWNII